MVANTFCPMYDVGMGLGWPTMPYVRLGGEGMLFIMQLRPCVLASCIGFLSSLAGAVFFSAGRVLGQIVPPLQGVAESPRAGMILAIGGMVVGIIGAIGGIIVPMWKVYWEARLANEQLVAALASARSDAVTARKESTNASKHSRLLELELTRLQARLDTEVEPKIERNAESIKKATGHISAILRTPPSEPFPQEPDDPIRNPPGDPLPDVPMKGSSDDIQLRWSPPQGGPKP
jgi:hypothetical protein